MSRFYERTHRLDGRAGVQRFAKSASSFGGPWNFLGGCLALVLAAVMLATGHYEAVGPLAFIGTAGVIAGLVMGPKRMVRSWFRSRS